MKNILLFSLCASTLTLGLWGCTNAPTPSVTNPQTDQTGVLNKPSVLKSVPTARGTISAKPSTTTAGTHDLTVKIHIDGISNDFNTQALKCNQIDAIQMKIIGLNMPEMNAISSNFTGCDITATFNSVPAGNLRAITLEATNFVGQKLSNFSIQGTVDVVHDALTTAEVSFRTTPTGDIVKELALNNGIQGKAYVSSMTSASLQTFVDQITEFSGTAPANYTYTTHPMQLDTKKIVTHIMNNQGDLSNIPTVANVSLAASTLSVTGLATGTISHEILVEDPSSTRLINPTNTPSTTLSISQIIPGNWLTTITNGGTSETLTLNFAAGQTLVYNMADTFAKPTWQMIANQPAVAYVNDYTKDTEGTKDVIGTRHGIYIKDGGNWQRSGMDTSNVLSVEKGIPTDTYYAGTEKDGMFASTNDGGNWSKISTSQGNDHLSIYKILSVSDGAGGENIYAATNDGVIERLNGNTNFTKVNGKIGGGDFAGATVGDLVRFNAPGNERLFISIKEGTHAGIYASKSANPGDGWVRIDVAGPATALAGEKPVSLDVDQGTGTERLRVLCENGSYYSALVTDIAAAVSPATPTPTGITWTKEQDAHTPNLTFTHMIAHEQTPSVASFDKVKGPDGGPAVWQSFPEFYPPEASSFVNRLNPESLASLSTENLVALTRSGILRKGLSTWDADNIGLQSAEITDMLYRPSDPPALERIFIATKHSGVFRYDPTNSVIEALPVIVNGDAGRDLNKNAQSVLDLDLDNAGNLIALTEDGIYALASPTTVTGGAWVSLAGDVKLPANFKATTLNYINNGDGQFQQLFVASNEDTAPTDTGIYALNCDGTVGNCITVASTASWGQIHNAPTASMADDAGTAGIFAGAKNGGTDYTVLEALVGGTVPAPTITWGTAGMTALSSSEPIDRLIMQGANVVAASSTERPVFIHRLVGSNWDNISGNLFLGAEDKILSMAHDGDLLLLGINQGGVKAIDLNHLSPTWYNYEGGPNNLNENTLSSLVVKTVAPKFLFAGSFGNGIFKTALP